MSKKDNTNEYYKGMLTGLGDPSTVLGSLGNEEYKSTMAHRERNRKIASEKRQASNIKQGGYELGILFSILFPYLMYMYLGTQVSKSIVRFFDMGVKFTDIHGGLQALTFIISIAIAVLMRRFFPLINFIFLAIATIGVVASKLLT